jgi:hypothetical protein
LSDLFTADELADAARRESGLESLGDPDWREGLERLLESAAREGDLNALGRELLRGWIHRRLFNRLRVVDWSERHPEIRRERVARPLFVVGMLRTGTTLLCELLARDPANRPLWKWEGLDCLPPPERAHFGDDPRIAKMVAEMELTYALVPALKAIHFEPGDGPTECVALLGQSFRSQDWVGLFHVPGYSAWLHGDCDMRPAYRFHHLALQLLQSRAPGRWTLKAPGHLFALDALVAEYPDARFIVTHRDPHRTVASSASLSVTSRPESLTRSRLDPRPYYGALWLGILGTMTDRLIAFRQAQGDASFFDLHYLDFVRDPIAAVRGAYAHFGEALSEPAEAAMRSHLAASPQGRYGKHAYASEAFGLRREAIDQRFRAYCERFAVESES